jgi:hypothetical protein
MPITPLGPPVHRAIQGYYDVVSCSDFSLAAIFVIVSLVISVSIIAAMWRDAKFLEKKAISELSMILLIIGKKSS